MSEKKCLCTSIQLVKKLYAYLIIKKAELWSRLSEMKIIQSECGKIRTRKTPNTDTFTQSPSFGKSQNQKPQPFNV